MERVPRVQAAREALEAELKALRDGAAAAQAALEAERQAALEAEQARITAQAALRAELQGKLDAAVAAERERLEQVQRVGGSS